MLHSKMVNEQSIFSLFRSMNTQLLFFYHSFHFVLLISTFIQTMLWLHQENDRREKERDLRKSYGVKWVIFFGLPKKKPHTEWAWRVDLCIKYIPFHIIALSMTGLLSIKSTHTEKKKTPDKTTTQISTNSSIVHIQYV